MAFLESPLRSTNKRMASVRRAWAPCKKGDAALFWGFGEDHLLATVHSETFKKGLRPLPCPTAVSRRRWSSGSEGCVAALALHCRRFYNAAGVAFRSPGLASGDEDPGGQPWVNGPTSPERCRRSIPSGAIGFLIDGCHTRCSSFGNGTPAAFGTFCALVPRVALRGCALVACPGLRDATPAALSIGTKKCATSKTAIDVDVCSGRKVPVVANGASRRLPATIAGRPAHPVGGPPGGERLSWSRRCDRPTREWPQ